MVSSRNRPTANARRGGSSPSTGEHATGTAARLRAGLAIALGVSLWLGAAWGLPPPPPAEVPATPAPTPEIAEPVATSSRSTLSSRSEPPPAPPEDPLAEALGRLAPEGRVDDRRRDDLDWPFVALDPEREADRAAQAAREAPAEAFDVHVVAPGETLLGIAISLDVDEDKLATLNKLADRDRLAVGQKLLVPPGHGTPVRPTVTSRGATLRPRFIWPHPGPITTYFGEAGAVWIGGHHTGLDLAGRIGEPVLAAEAGTVLEAGWAETHGFGNYILIDHGVGYQTLYGHLSVIRVKAGQAVVRGQRIGDVGSTGVSTGPHLHFEMHLDGRPVDPLDYLPTGR